LSNPVVANSSGVFPSVYWDNAQAVRVRVREADGTVLGDADPYFSDGLSSTDLSFLQSGTGAQTRTVQAKLRDTVNARDFGAVGDGVTNDTAAIQAAINAVQASGGGTVLLTADAFRVGTLNLPQDVMIEGQGRFSTRLVALSGHNAPIIQSLGTITNIINRGGVRDLAIVGSGKSNTGCVGIKTVFSNRCTYENIDIFATYIGMWFENVWQLIVTAVHVHGGGTDQNYIGFYFAPKDVTPLISNAVIAIGCVAQGVEYCGFRIENGNGSKFTNCEAIDGVHAWFIGAPSSGSEVTEFMHFSCCLGDTTSDDIWRIERGSAADIRQMQFVDCWAGNSVSGSAVVVRDANQLVFSGWQIIAPTQHGMHFIRSARCVVSAIHIRDYSRFGGNFNGIRLEDSIIIKFSTCEIFTTGIGAGAGFRETGTSDNNCLIGSNSVAGITLVGAGSVQANNTTL
jgi:hypothetical protein